MFSLKSESRSTHPGLDHRRAGHLSALPFCSGSICYFWATPSHSRFEIFSIAQSYSKFFRYLPRITAATI
jgi:hypothetical protein